jgi:hypothetical protein
LRVMSKAECLKELPAAEKDWTKSKLSDSGWLIRLPVN